MITINLSIKLVSPNVQEHWTKRSKRNRILKIIIQSEWNKLPIKPQLPCKIIITRVAPRMMDHRDNFVSSCKGLIDRISEMLVPGLAAGRADSDPRLEFEFKQEKGKVREYFVRVEFQSVEKENLLI